MSFTIRDLKESSIYQEIAEITVSDLLYRMVARRFPGFELGGEIVRIMNLNALEGLCLELYDLPDEAALQARLAELMPRGE